MKKMPLFIAFPIQKKKKKSMGGKKPLKSTGRCD